MSKTSAYSLRQATRAVRGLVRQLNDLPVNERIVTCSRLSAAAIHIHWIEEVLVAAEAQLAALQSLKDAE